MFGPRMRVEYDGFGILLRPWRREEMKVAVGWFQNMNVIMFNGGTMVNTLEDEEKWYDRNIENDETCHWAIVPDGQDEPIGGTGVFHLNFHNSCISGITIDQPWWGRGIATRAHLARTLYAADFLNRYTIQSCVWVPNEGSLKALLRAGYTVTGKSLRDNFRRGQYLDTYHLTWVHPDPKILAILYPEGVPSECKPGIEKARIALEKARKVVQFV